MRTLTVLALTSGIIFGASCNCGSPTTQDQDGGTDDAGLPGVIDAGEDGGGVVTDGGGGDDGGAIDGGEDAGTVDAGVMGDLAKSCLPCTDDSACGVGRCVDYGGVLGCAALCDPENPSCLPGFSCVAENDGGMPVCLPTNDICCVDNDGDSHGPGVECAGPDCDDSDPSSYGGGTEVCDNKDNDCNGSVDDNIPAQTCGKGVCQVTVPGCSNGTVPACTPGTPTPELCDGLDNDCNGVTDDGLGQTSCGVGACAVTVDNCVGGQAQQCTPGTPTSEVCNGVDDNCDGTVDENLGQSTCGLGICQVTVDNCVAGQPQQCVAGQPAVETCNGLDDNCDGVVDDGLGTTTCGTGTCQMTIQNCVGGQVQQCVPGMPGVETCNGLDDNCDGTVDEGLGQSTCGTGACQVTVQNCVNGQSQTCVPGAPSAEQCNGIDDNCDGTVDEGLGQTTCGVGACTVTVQNCVSGQPVQCVPSQPNTEVCDGIDNDCDGVVDNGNPGGGAACNTGLAGVCAAGVTACSNGGIICVQTVQPSVETCDGLDNDCDGAADNGNPGGNASCNTGNQGVCSAGTTACTNGAIVCNQNTQPSAETCDGLDNNCNGSVDEGNPGGNAACNTGLQGVCSAGTTACTNGAIACNQNVQPSADLCDGKDNNCDGQVDEGNPGGGATCATGKPGVCATGTTACTAGAVVCNQNVQPSAEVCDGLDNDCNGVADNGNPGGGVSCATGKPGVCSTGVTACAGGGVIVCNQLNQPSAEVCDGLDNDCNGVTDNGNPGGGLSCNTGKPGVCAPGTTACSAGAVVCNQNVQPSAEVCDGLDNDCNGVADNGNPGGGQACNTAKPGICAAGTTACTGGAISCNQNQQPQTEVCDGLDNNCDGAIDNSPTINDNIPNSCAQASSLTITVPPGGVQNLTGYVDVKGDDWFRVNFSGVPGAGGYYHPSIQLTSTGGGQFVMQVINGTSCATVPDCNLSLTQWAMFYPNDPNGCNGDYGVFTCTDNVPKQTSFLVRVLRVSGTPTCTPYTVQITNQ